MTNQQLEGLKVKDHWAIRLGSLLGVLVSALTIMGFAWTFSLKPKIELEIINSEKAAKEKIKEEMRYLSSTLEARLGRMEARQKSSTDEIKSEIKSLTREIRRNR